MPKLIQIHHCMVIAFHEFFALICLPYLIFILNFIHSVRIGRLLYPLYTFYAHMFSTPPIPRRLHMLNTHPTLHTLTMPPMLHALNTSSMFSVHLCLIYLIYILLLPCLLCIRRFILSIRFLCPLYSPLILPQYNGYIVIKNKYIDASRGISK